MAWKNFKEFVADTRELTPTEVKSYFSSHPVLADASMLMWKLGEPQKDTLALINFLSKGKMDMIYDKYGNGFIVVGENSRTLFTSHVDTVYNGKDVAWIKRFIREDNEGGKYLITDGKTILGADDRAGVAIMLHLIAKKVPGTYAFFKDEEVGGLGSKDWAKNVLEKGDFDRAISFDRRGFDSVVYRQRGRDTASKECAQAIADAVRPMLKLEPDPTGSFTDCASCADLIPECLNLSVGYFGAHGKQETLCLSWLVKAAKAYAKVDWESLPVVRKAEPRKIRPVPRVSTWSKFSLPHWLEMKREKSEFEQALEIAYEMGPEDALHLLWHFDPDEVVRKLKLEGSYKLWQDMFRAAALHIVPDEGKP